MEKAIQSYITYIHRTKGASANTEVSYKRDLSKLVSYLQDQGIQSLDDVKEDTLRSYMVYLEKNHYAPSSVCRNVSSIRAFFRYLYKRGRISYDPSERLSPPHIEKKAPLILSVDGVSRLLDAPDLTTDKGKRDKAMLELLYATGIRVSELISLKTEDVNMKMNYIVCHTRKSERVIPFGASCEKALKVYLNGSRDEFVKEHDVTHLFPNVSGQQMSRQGFWKILKGYTGACGLPEDITPHTLRHSFATHMLQNGADMNSLKDMLGHADIATTQLYAQIGLKHIRDVYNKAHPRK